jgi:catechol 2,3-dioxygenase-like lactoylglutathione lyase family enzyme
MPLTTATYHHTSFLTRDIERTARELARTLGLTFDLWTLRCDPATVRGRPQPFSMRLAVSRVAPAAIELIQPLTPSVYDEHLDAHGEGFHHTCVIYPSRDDYRNARETLLARGLEIIQAGAIADSVEFAYLDLPPLRSAIEILYIRDLPPPEQTIA